MEGKMPKEKEENLEKLKEQSQELAESFFDTTEDKEDWLSEYEGQLAVDVYQTKSNVIIKAPIAGVKPDEIDITISDDVVTIKGERKEEKEIDRENYFAQECYWGAFSRSIILPVVCNPDKTEAEFKNGVLTISIPKANQEKVKRVRVKSS